MILSAHTDSRTYEVLLQNNEREVRRWEEHPLFEYVKTTYFQTPERLYLFMKIMLFLSGATRKWLYERSKNAKDFHFQELFQGHFSEEENHEEELRADIQRIFGTVEDFSDLILAAVCDWFIERMEAGSDRERLLLSHLVAEQAASYFYKVLSPRIHLDTNHFKEHVEEDEGHGHMGVELLRGVFGEECMRLLQVQSEGWDQLHLFFNRTLGLLKEI